MTLFTLRTQDEKYKTVIDKNTFFYYSEEFEEGYDARLTLISQNLESIREKVMRGESSQQLFLNLIEQNSELGLTAILAISGLSQESFKRLVTFIRIVDDPKLNSVCSKDKWQTDKNSSRNDISEWSTTVICSKLSKDSFFREGMVRIFFEGQTIPILSRSLPLFDFKKLSKDKLTFKVEAMIDTIVRYKQLGSRTAEKGNNPENLLRKLISDLNFTYDAGDLPLLTKHEFASKRTMDCIIPNKQNPKVIIESSYQRTTASGQGDKSKTENVQAELIKHYYPNAKFIGFLDGIGWYARKSDARRMVDAYHDVFTYHPEELNRFRQFLITELE